SSNSQTPIRILLADDHQLFRAGVAGLLAQEPDFVVVGQAENGKEAIDLAQKTQPDVALLDVQMPVCNGLEAARRLLVLQPEIKIIMLTISDRDADLFTAVKSGAQGYLLKSSISANELIEAVQRVAASEAIITPSLVPLLLAEFAALSQQPNLPSPVPNPTLNRLTNREREILELVAQGLTNRETATQFIISENTVRTHLRNILDKLHVQNRLQAAAILHQQDN
ncbi:MAG: response regulator transcription factor, partial [Anaerolineales bacterium]|nr:response regulator transcription factor [Anaerolineales bacterium]